MEKGTQYMLVAAIIAGGFFLVMSMMGTRPALSTLQSSLIVGAVAAVAIGYMVTKKKPAE